eukprot:Nitzschia sp. Nitz4//scaffold1_size375055//293179//297150//NITZ4_000316-RA/size375055-processed-gene-0.459-mRNA-1//-1//CDS//3329541165//1065//frame0
MTIPEDKESSNETNEESGDAVVEEPTPEFEDLVASTAPESNAAENVDTTPVPPNDAYQRKIHHWKNSPFAVGCVNVHWKDDRKWFRPKECKHLPRHRDSMFSAYVCGCIGAGRVGNMAVLAQTTESYEHVEVDPETGDRTTSQRERPKLLCVVGPFWYCNVFLTFPLVLGIPAWVIWRNVNSDTPLFVVVSYGLCVFVANFALAMIACRDPGILYRHKYAMEEEWRWNDQAKTYRPRDARFDPDCQLVVEGFDHTYIMSQRRGGANREAAVVAEEMVPFSESLDPPKAGLTMDRRAEGDVPTPLATPADGDAKPAPLSLDEAYEKEEQSIRLKQWREGYFAARWTAPTWSEELHRWRTNIREEISHVDAPDQAPCVCCSALVCGLLGAGRVGNMAVLKQSTEWVEEEEEDEAGNVRTRRVTRPKLDFVVGPYWPMLLLVTYPLIFGVSIATMLTAIPGKHPIVILFWAACTISLIVALGLTAFRDPGILPRYNKAPAQSDGFWRWSDRAQSFRPRGAWYDADTGVIVDGFDHTCWWTGGPVGRKNNCWFKIFLILMYTCLLMDTMFLLLLVAGAASTVGQRRLDGIDDTSGVTDEPTAAPTWFPTSSDSMTDDETTDEPTETPTDDETTDGPSETPADDETTDEPSETPTDDETTDGPSPADDTAGEVTDAPSAATIDTVGSPAPSASADSSTPFPVHVSTPAPSAASGIFNPVGSPTPFPSVAHTEPTGDDWFDKDSSVEDLEHDRTAVLVVLVTLGIGICLSIISAQQILHNPQGCCASICRIFVALTCGITRCVCFPCRMICGCTNKERRTHDIIGGENGDYTHDLELS